MKIDYYKKIKTSSSKKQKDNRKDSSPGSDIHKYIYIYIYIIRKIAIDNNNKKKKNISGFIENV